MSITRKRPMLTMDSRLSEIPPDWIKWIEPKIVRGSFLPCWIWSGALDRNGYPLLRHPARGQISARRFVAEMFWDFPDIWFVTCNCHHMNCLNPSHIIVQAESPRWSPPPRL